MKVYKQYSQEQLNDQYNVREFVPGYAGYLNNWEEQSDRVGKSYKHHENISYGIHPLECLDIFPAGNPDARTVIFIHGGYWHLLDKNLFYFLAPSFLVRNINIVFINYPLAPDASMDRIVSSCNRAIEWLHNNIIFYNGNPREMYVMGHSAGGHLAMMLLSSELERYLKGVISLSGLFRLKPVMLSYMNANILMNIETAEKNSPVLLKPLNECPIILAVGINETDEFKDQSLEFYEHCKSAGRVVEFLTVKDRNHYSILEDITEGNSLLASAIFRMMCNT